MSLKICTLSLLTLQSEQFLSLHRCLLICEKSVNLSVFSSLTDFRLQLVGKYNAPQTPWKELKQGISVVNGHSAASLHRW